MSDQDADNEFNKICQFYVGLIEHEKQLIAAAGTDTKKVNEHQKSISEYKGLLAQHLGDRSVTYISASGEMLVTPCWDISGQPPKRFKAQAREWMAARNLRWNPRDLIEALRDAIEDGEVVPEGYFGLRVERTVQIEPWATAQPPLIALKHNE
jgi:hypothetical protein